MIKFGARPQSRYNRTYVELKPKNVYLDALECLGYNRTYVELKPGIIDGSVLTAVL